MTRPANIDASAATTSSTAPVAPGSRWESAWLALLLACDLASTPFHLVAFLCTAPGQRRALREALERSAR
jgi:hypothetical protein